MSRGSEAASCWGCYSCALENKCSIGISTATLSARRLPPQQRDALHGNLGGWDPLEASLSRRCIFRHLNTSQTSRIHTSSGRWPRRCEQTACSRTGPFIGAQPPALEHQPQAHHTDAVALCPTRFRARRDGDLKAPRWHGWMISFQQQADRMSQCTLQPLCLVQLCSPFDPVVLC